LVTRFQFCEVSDLVAQLDTAVTSDPLDIGVRDVDEVDVGDLLEHGVESVHTVVAED